MVGDVLGLSENTVKRIWEMRFTHEMRKHSEAIAERIGLIDTTEIGELGFSYKIAGISPSFPQLLPHK